MAMIGKKPTGNFSASEESGCRGLKAAVGASGCASVSWLCEQIFCECGTYIGVNDWENQ